MSRTAARVWVFAIITGILVVGLGSVALALLGMPMSLSLGGIVTAILGILYVAAWMINVAWG